MSSRARDLLDAGDPRGAIPLFEKAIAMAGTAGGDAVLSGLLGDLAVAYRRSGEIEAAIASNERAIEVASNRGDYLDMARWLGNLGGIHQLLDDLDAAESCFHHAMDAAVRAHSPEQVSIAGSHLAGIMGQRGRFSEAAEMMTSASGAAAGFPEVAEILRSLWLQLNLRWAHFLWQERRVGEMHEVCERALEAYGPGPPSEAVIGLLTLLGVSRENDGDIAAARTAVLRAADVSDAMGDSDNARQLRDLERRMRS